MRIENIPTPEIYNSSSDFRFFRRWIASCFEKIQYDTENAFDLYDSLRCPEWLLWMLADTMGFKYDDRLCSAFNRLVLVYFMSMIRNKGSKDGVTLAAEVNLAQFNIESYGQENDVLYDRLEDTSIPVNSAYVTSHTAEGYIDVVYFSDKIPTDACIEYVRPLGMYLFQHAGVRYDARTYISVDARLTNYNDIGISIGSTHVGHYSRDDYARMQRMQNESGHIVNKEDTRRNAWYRNKKAEGAPDPAMNPGYRALYSLQIANNDHVVKSLIEPIFSIGYGPQNVSTYYPNDYLKKPYSDRPLWNLRYDRDLEESTDPDVWTLDEDRSTNILNGRPVVNPIMSSVGDAISMNKENTKYTEVDDSGNIKVVEK